MADIELVVRIPEEMYAQIIDEKGIDAMLIPYKDIIKNGTPLDKIRAEIEELKIEDNSHNICFKVHNDVVEIVLRIIDKYKAET